MKSNEAFASRSKDIFANIDSLAAEKQDTQKQEKRPEEREEKSKNSQKIEEFKHRESIFRSPNESGWPPTSSRFDSRNKSRFRQRDRPRHPKKVPDYIVNPQKYKKYDLSDVDQMSDRSNTRAAFDFLRQLKDRKSNDDQDEPLENPGKISFKKPKKTVVEESASSTSIAVDGGHKRVMPECVVGASKKAKSSDQKSSNKAASKAKVSKVSLAHLDDEDDD